jgi:hypothetical protein
MEKRITPKEWNEASTEQRAQWLKDGVLMREEDLDLLTRPGGSWEQTSGFEYPKL